MRFDYQPPNIKSQALISRRSILLSLILTGFGCIVLALISQGTPHKINSDSELYSIKGPSLISTNKPILSLDSGLTIAQEKPLVANQPLLINSASLEPKTTTETIQEKWHTITVQVGDTMSKLFDKLGLSAATLHDLMATGKHKTELTELYPGQKLHFLLDDSKELKEIKFNLSLTKALHVAKTDSGFKYHYEEKKPTKKINFSTAKITGSLYSSAQTVGLDDKLIMQMADIFGCDIDFSLDIRDEDSFKVLYEEEYVQDKKVDTGKILAVEFKNQGKSYKAIRYTDEKGNSGYYSPEGYSLQKAFLRSPVEFTRISSHFSNARRHPILHKIRSHKGVDYAAPMGTPVKSSGDGRITFIGTKGGYGKSIEITHGQKYSTFYAHLSRFGKKLKLGSTVKQGDIIGYVGKTGLATGAHLHYEFRINGVHHNPVTVSLPRSLPIANKYQKDFSVHASNMLDMLDSHSKVAKND